MADQAVTGQQERPANGVLPDLDSVEQIAMMVDRFYTDIRADEQLGPIFNDLAQVNWDTHLPKLTSFWSRALLGLGQFNGNPMAKHIAINQQVPLTIELFNRWLTLFAANLEGSWEGPNTNRARAVAQNVARVHSSQLSNGAV